MTEREGEEEPGRPAALSTGTSPEPPVSAMTGPGVMEASTKSNATSQPRIPAVSPGVNTVATVRPMKTGLVMEVMEVMRTPTSSAGKR